MNEGERRAYIDGTVAEEPGRARHQGHGQTEHPHPLQFHDVGEVGHRRPDLEHGRAMRQNGDVVAPLRSADEQLARDGPVARVERQRLLRGEAPIRVKPETEIVGAKAPERRIPGSAVPSALLRGRRDVPSLHDRQQEAVPHEPLPIRACEICCTHGDDSAVLECSKDGQGAGQLLWGRRQYAERSAGFLPTPMSGLWLTPRQSADRRRFHGPGIPGDTRRTCAKGRLFGLYSCLLLHFAGAQGLPSDRRPVDLHTRKSVIRGRPCVACHVQIRRCGVHRESHQRHRRVLVMKVRADRSDAAGCRR